MTILSVLYLLKLDNFLAYAIVAFVLLSLDAASFIFLRNYLRQKVYFLSFIILHAAIHFSLIFIFFIFQFKAEPYSFSWIYFYSGSLFSFYVAKIAFLAFVLSSILYLKKHKAIRIQYLFSILASVLIFTALIFGIAYGRFNYETTEYKVKVNRLFKSNNSIRVVQVSDLHLGSFFGNEDYFIQLVNKINSLQPDIVIITGDFVNIFAKEIEPFMGILKEIKASYGVFGNLGNHDYGDYYRWKSAKNKVGDQILLKQLLERSNVTLLNNEHRLIIHNHDTLFLAGVENWGEYPYRQEANLNKAITGITHNKKVLLLSHDPNFWAYQVHKHQNIAITFSGHTHGMQIGFRFFGKEWSPFSIGQKYTSGWYKEHDQLLYINKGLGGSLYPGRVGIRPEISVFTIH